MAFTKADAEAIVSGVFKFRETIVHYVRTHLDLSVDKSYIECLAHQSLGGLRPIIRKCPTLLDVKHLVDRRYAKIVKELSECQEEELSFERFERICTALREAISISSRFGDSSCLLSPGFYLGRGLLEDRPKRSTSTAGEYFSLQEQEMVMRVVADLRDDLRSFYEVYKLKGPGIWFVRPALLHDEEADSCRMRLWKCLFRKTPSGVVYSPDMSALFPVSDTLHETLNAQQDEVLELIETAKYFDKSFIEAYWRLMLPFARKYLPKDQANFSLESNLRLAQVKFIEQNADDIRMKWVQWCDCEKFWEGSLASEQVLCARQKITRKLEEIRTERRKMVKELKVLGLTPKEVVGNLGCCAEMDEDPRVPSGRNRTCLGNERKNLNKARKRHRWKSPFAGRIVGHSEIEVDQNVKGYTPGFWVGNVHFELSAARAGNLLDELFTKIDKGQKNPKIGFTKADRCHFKRICGEIYNEDRDMVRKKVGPEYFFKNVMMLISHEKSRRIAFATIGTQWLRWC